MASRQPRQPAVLIIAHGAGSTADFVDRAFPAAACGLPVRSLQDRTGDPCAIAQELLAAADRARRRGLAPVIGGVSVGAHAAAAAALMAPGHLLHGCVLVMPAWSGQGSPDSATARAAEEVAAAGADEVLRRLDRDPALRHDWVAAELRRAWRDRPTLAAELATAARSTAPRPEDLRAIDLPTLVLALADDPVHPLAVARTWAAAVPGAQLRIVARGAPGADLAVFGRQVARWSRQGFSEPR